MPQNMPQTLNSLISSTNNKVAKGNQGQTMMDIKSSEIIFHPSSKTIIHPKWVYLLKICLKA